jgi:tripartite-type tricarboxylate transporter receptor subunit TctC
VTAAEFDAEQYFKGKTINLVVDFKPGGGTDLQARYFASNWGRYIPGHPKIKVSNLFCYNVLL